MTAPIEGSVNREFKTYRNENGGEVRAHVVTEDTAGTIREAYSGRTRDVNEGDVLVESGRPDEYQVVSKDDFSAYSEDDSTVEGVVSNDDSDDDSDAFDPSDHTAAEVREYLNAQRAKGDDTEYARVENAERDGKNRASAFPVL